MVLPLSILPSNRTYKEKDDVTEILGVKKYDPEGEKERQLLTQKADNSKNPIIKFLMRYKWFRKRYIKPKKGGFPSWIVKTDECFKGDTYINTDIGKLRIADIVNNNIKCNVLSYDGHQTRYSKIIGIFKKKYRGELLELRIQLTI